MPFSPLSDIFSSFAILSAYLINILRTTIVGISPIISAHDIFAALATEASLGASLHFYRFTRWPWKNIETASVEKSCLTLLTAFDVYTRHCLILTAHSVRDF